jgi:uncharacterized protein YjbI with pentapeptide repeats
VELLPQQRQQLHDALVAAFPSKPSLEQMLSHQLDKNLDAIAGGNNLQEIVFDLIKTVESRGWIEDLVRAAYNENPGNPKLKAIAERLQTQAASLKGSERAENVLKSSNTSNLIQVAQENTGVSSREHETVQLIPALTSETIEPKASRKLATFVLSGTIDSIDEIKLKAIFEHLQKIARNAGENVELTILNVEEGSIKITLGGSPESLKWLEEVFKSGELTEVLGIPVEDVQLEDVTTEEYKSHVVQALINQKFIGNDLSNFDLSNVNLNGANLSGVNLNGANLSGADLSEAYLSGAYLRRAYLSGANLSSANLSEANLSEAYLSEANLRGANLRGANLRGANLRGANLRGANLRDASLRGASLRGVNLSTADLKYADLKYADLSDAIVVNALFGGNEGLTEDMKRDLKQRGAIFGDYRSPVLTPH